MKIVVVDNHPVILKFMSTLLMKEGHQVLTASDGLSALHILRTFVPDIIYIDLIMPNIGGEKLCQIIRGMPEMRDVSLVILSSIAAEQPVDFSRFGADACIAKGPFDKMAVHILATLNELDAGTLGMDPSRTLGVDEVYPRQLTRELLSVKRHFELILESMAEGIFELTPQADIVYANHAAIMLVGLREERVLASSFIALFEEPDRSMIKGLFERGEIPSRTIAIEAPVRLGEREVSLTFLPVRQEGRDRLLALLDDVTEKRRMEGQLLQAQKLEAVGMLAGGIAHDFNNLLTGIMGNISLALIYGRAEEDVIERLAQAEKACERAKDLVQHLLTFSKGGAPIKRSIPLGGLVRNTAATMLTGNALVPEFSLPDDLWPVEADEGQMAQVVSNLITNATQAMPRGGVIEIGCENVSVSEEDRLPLSPGRYVRMSVTDHGNGIPEEHLPKIFDPYFTTREGGSGLGLATVYSIIKKHGGHISVVSVLGKGTTFHIHLPASNGHLRNRGEKERKVLPGKGKVLVMDDEDLVRKVASKILEHLGYSVQCVEDGQAAIEMYKRAKDEEEPFSAVILDLTIPKGMGGKEAIRGLLEVDPSVRAIVCSGYSNDPVMSHFSEYGFCGVIAKPYAIQKLSETLHEVLQAVA